MPSVASKLSTKASHDQQYMLQALALAERGLFSTTPNPRVGCLLVKDGQVIAEGWHKVAGSAHAEVAALEQLADANDAQGATCYVTLEPCSHQGRTAPCTASLIAAKVARVVIAMVDPNPQVSGKGIEQLKAAGIEVEVGVLEAQAKALNPGFIKRMNQGLPWTFCKLAMSIDGKTAMASGESKWITGEAARADVQLLRARCDAIITGTGTVAKDDPSLNVRLEDFPAEYSQAELAQKGIEVHQPLRVVIDAKGVIEPSHKIINQPGQVLIASSEEKLSDYQAKFADKQNVELLVCPLTKANKVDLAFVLKALAERGFNEVLVESGANLAGAFVSAQLVDQLQVYIAPKLLGHKGMSLLHLPELEQLADAYQFSVQQVTPCGEDLRISYLTKSIN